MTAFPTLIDEGITPAAGSAISPGRLPITREEALRVNTLNGAYNAREEKIKGSITARASSRTLSCWPATSAPSTRTRSRTSRSSARWVGGNTAYQA